MVPTQIPVVPPPKASVDNADVWREKQRHLTLDVLRGFALFGILFRNIFIFAIPRLDPVGDLADGLAYRPAGGGHDAARHAAGDE